MDEILDAGLYVKKFLETHLQMDSGWFSGLAAAAAVVTAIVYAFVTGRMVIHIRRQATEAAHQVSEVARQAAEATRTRHATVWLSILERYIENRRLRAVRRFIHWHMMEVNDTIHAVRLRAQDEGRDLTRDDTRQIGEKIKALSDTDIANKRTNEEFALEDINDVLSMWQNISLLVRHDFVPRKLADELYAMMREMWGLLEPLVRFERERRKADRLFRGEKEELEKWFCDDFEKLVIKIREDKSLARWH